MKAATSQFRMRSEKKYAWPTCGYKKGLMGASGMMEP